MEKQRLGLTEIANRYKERKIREQEENVMNDDGIFDNQHPVNQQVPTEPVQNGEQQPKTARKVRPYSTKKTDENKQTLIGLEKEPPFSQRYTRVTTYLENSLNERVKELSRYGRISSVTALVNAALTEFLDKHGIQ